MEAHGQTAVQCRQSDSSQQQNSSRAVSNQIGHAPVLLEATTTESTEVKGSDTSQLTLLTETQNILGLGNPAADEQFRAKKTTYLRCRTMAGVFQPKSGIHPFGWKPKARQRFSAGKTKFAAAEL